MKRYLPGFACLLFLWAPNRAGEIHGRVIDRGTLASDGSAKGISGVRISVYDGKRVLATTATNARGGYRIKRVTVARCRITYRARGYQPSSVSREYAPADTSSRDVYLDATRLEDALSASKGKGKDKDKESSGTKSGTKSGKGGGYYEGVARGFLALSRNGSFFGEDLEDSISRLSDYFDPRDSSADYRGVICELLWAEFLSEDRPLETRYYLASALAPMVDSLGWGKLRGMSRYLEVPPEPIQETGNALREAFRNPKKLPNPKEIHKLGMSVSLASQIANEYLSDPGLSEKSKDRFLAQWKKAWGKDAPSFKEDADDEAFSPAAIMTKLAASKSDNAEVHYLRGRGLFRIPVREPL